VNAETRTYRIGIQGCGTIFPQYVEGIRRFPTLEIVWATDIDDDRSAAAQERFGVPRVGRPEAMLADGDVDIVVNLTWPRVHAKVTVDALAAGKSVFSEKPLAVTTGDAEQLITLAESYGLALGSAPETFMGSWGETSRAVIDSGALGEVVGGVAFVKHNYVEYGHPDPGFLFAPGAGPALDRGPYYVAALINLLGPVASVSGVTRWGPTQRQMRFSEARVSHVDVQVPTHWTAIMTFVSGAVVTVVFSNDIWRNNLPEIEIYGTAGSMTLPNPNFFDGDVHIAGLEREAPWTLVTPPTPPRGNFRGRGIVDMMRARESGRPQQADARLALHTLEVLTAIEASSASHCAVPITSRVERPPWPDVAAPIRTLGPLNAQHVPQEGR
jgi:predicted dehydrogenase